MIKTAITILLIFGIIFCGQDVAWSDSFTLSDNTGISHPGMRRQESHGLSVLHNRVLNAITISVTGVAPPRIYEIKLFNTKGAQVKKVRADKGEIELDVVWDASMLPAGIYVLCVTTGTNTINRRFALVR